VPLLYESVDRRGTVITTQGKLYHDQQPRNTPTPSSPDSDNPKCSNFTIDVDLVEVDNRI
jgi:hypothetical protein